METQTNLYHNVEEINDLVKEFEACTLKSEKWTHYAHLTVGLWYISQYPYEQAIELIRQNIQRYNASRGVVMTKDNGYHETITLFYAWVIKKYLTSIENDCPLLDLANELINKFGYRQLPFKYYSKERLMSWEARTNWLDPDLTPLD